MTGTVALYHIMSNSHKGFSKRLDWGNSGWNLKPWGQLFKINDVVILVNDSLKFQIVGAPAIRKMVIGGRKVAQISFIPSCRGTHWKLENQCLVNFKSCKSVEIIGCILLHMTFCNVILENEGVHTKLVISLLLLILHHCSWSHFKA